MIFPWTWNLGLYKLQKTKLKEHGRAQTLPFSVLVVGVVRTTS